MNMYKKESAKQESAEQALLKTAKKRFAAAQSEWSDFFTESRKVLKFVGGEQWDNQLKNNRTNAGLPCLTANSLPVFLRQITNESRQNCPAIQIDPKDGGADQETAEIFSDLIRGIEQASGGATAYDVASWYAACTGLGFFRVVSEYESENSFLQKLVIKQIDDPETVLIDPNHKKIDGSDMEYCFILSSMSKDEYKRAYSETKLAKDAEVSGWSSNTSSWVKEDEVVIAEYYYKEYTPATLYQVYNSVTGETYESTDKPDQELVDGAVLFVLNTRPTYIVEVKWCKINDVEVLEETTWPGDCIPVVAVKGDESWFEGKRKLKGAVADAMDSQRALNYFFSLQAELVSLAPKAPYVGEIRQFANFEHIWRDANVAPSAYLPYNAVEVAGGMVLPPPQRQSTEVPIQAAMALCAQARDHIKAIFGVFDASLGAMGNEVSGKAILARTAQSHTTTYHFYDNLVKAIQHCGSILVETIPTFYADERQVQLIKRNGQASISTINSNGRDLTNGSYGVVVETGPSYATRRQDSVDHMITLGAAYPQALPLIADLIASESDWPGSKAIAARLRMALPQEIQQAEAATGQGISPEAQAQFAISQVKMLTSQLEQLTAADNQAKELLKAADEEIKLLKMKGAIDLEKATMDKDIKQQQLNLDEVEAELSFKLRVHELQLQERLMKINEAKLAITAAQATHEVIKEAHDRDIGHIDRMEALSVKLPSMESRLSGIDPSFQSVSGEELGNA